MEIRNPIPQFLPMDGKRIKIYHKGIKKWCTNCFKATNQKIKQLPLPDTSKEKWKKVVTETSLNWYADVGEQILFERDANFFSLENVKKVMLEVKPKTCYGYDNIPVRVLLDGIDYLIKPFHKL